MADEEQKLDLEREIEDVVAASLAVLGLPEPSSREDLILSREHLTQIVRFIAVKTQEEADARSLDDLIDEYEEALTEIHERFGYVENWRSIPIDLDDKRECWWFLREDLDEVVYGDDEHPYDPQDIADGNCFTNEIYKQRFLKKWVYETDTHTMICVDTHTDGNKFLQIFRNSNRKPALDGDGNVIN